MPVRQCANSSSMIVRCQVPGEHSQIPMLSMPGSSLMNFFPQQPCPWENSKEFSPARAAPARPFRIPAACGIKIAITIPESSGDNLLQRFCSQRKSKVKLSLTRFSAEKFHFFPGCYPDSRQSETPWERPTQLLAEAAPPSLCADLALYHPGRSRQRIPSWVLASPAAKHAPLLLNTAAALRLIRRGRRSTATHRTARQPHNHNHRDAEPARNPEQVV